MKKRCSDTQLRVALLILTGREIPASCLLVVFGFVW